MIKFKNIAIALKSPIKAAQYSAAYWSYKRAVASFAGLSNKEVEKLYCEIFESDFIKDIAERSDSPVGFSNLTMLAPFRAPTLYVITRILKPEHVVETGVANGFSSAFILHALEANKKGRLYSIDLPNQPGQVIEKQTGWLVSDDLRSRWDLIIGSSRDMLEPLMKKLQAIDIFYHDSEHSYENMMFEFKLAWKYIKPDGYMLADDITDNSSYNEFVRDNDCRHKELFKLGIMQKLNRGVSI
ncbi:MAG: class I SAM-dependent methyltransferase [Candidatus Omnitrophica bacterium]|nr:class I SAM-dependent methyltransferase [Candidatus Omnitrophota bacterium]